jgi:hypothetical protein
MNTTAKTANMRRYFATILGAAAIAAAVLASSAPANAQAPVRLGILRCQVDGATGRILGSRRELSCLFERANAHPLERYAGEIVRIGIDLGSTEYSDIAWAVFALARPYSIGSLQGTYAGLSAGISVGVGLGANVLIGGLEQSFALQPVSIETSRGLNLALGVGKLELISVGIIE